MTQSQLTWLLIGVAIAGCSRHSHAPPAGAARPRHEAPPKAVPPAPGADASAGPVASRAAPAARPEPLTPPPVPAEFTLVRELACFEAKLMPLSAKAFVSCGPELLVIDGDQLRSDEALSKGLPALDVGWTWSIEDLAGNWPSAAWLGANRATAGAAQAEYYRWSGRRWSLMKKEVTEGTVAAVLPWTDSELLAVVHPPYESRAHFVALGTPAFTPPRFTPPGEHGCTTPVEAWAVLGAGDVMVAGGQPCEATIRDGALQVARNGIAAERFQAGTSQGRAMMLPEPADNPADALWQVTSLVAVSSSEVWLTARLRKTLAYLARWDGTQFRLEPQPFGWSIAQLWSESPDVFWATDLKGNVWRGRPKSWRRVDWLPPKWTKAHVAQVWVRGPGDLWLVTHSEQLGKSALYHGSLTASRADAGSPSHPD
jgi:hypothetical protein